MLRRLLALATLRIIEANVSSGRLKIADKQIYSSCTHFTQHPLALSPLERLINPGKYFAKHFYDFNDEIMSIFNVFIRSIKTLILISNIPTILIALSDSNSRLAFEECYKTNFSS